MKQFCRVVLLLCFLGLVQEDLSGAAETVIYKGKYWQKTDDGKKRTRLEATQYCQSLSLGGMKGWVLPSEDELYGLIKPGNIPTIDSRFNCRADVYITDLHMFFLGDEINSVIDFKHGHVIQGLAETIFDNLDGYVRCVNKKIPPPQLPEDSVIGPAMKILLSGGPQIRKYYDAYGNIVGLKSREKFSGADVLTNLSRKSDGKIEATTEIIASNNKKIRLEFTTSNQSILNAQGEDEVRIRLIKIAEGYQLSIPASLIHSWNETEVRVSSNGKSVPADLFKVVEQLDNRESEKGLWRANSRGIKAVWYSKLMPVFDYVVPVNISTDEYGNKAIQLLSGNKFLNEFFVGKRTFGYQVKYHVNYNLLNESRRTISLNVGMSEDDIFYNDALAGIGETRISFVVDDVSQHKEGVDYYIGPKGWYATDPKTGQRFAGENIHNIGSFQFLWDPTELGLGWKADAEFFAYCRIVDGNMEEEFNGDNHWNTKINYRRPSLNIIIPNNGAMLIAGSAQEVKWETYYWNNDIHEISFYYGPRNLHWESTKLIDRVSYRSQNPYSSSSYNWTVPVDSGDWKFHLVRLNEAGVTYLPPRDDANISIVENSSCDSNNLELCHTETQCSAVGGYWYENSCNADPKVTFSIEGRWNGTLVSNTNNCRWSTGVSINSVVSGRINGSFDAVLTENPDGDYCYSTNGEISGNLDVETGAITFGTANNYIGFSGHVDSSGENMSGTWTSNTMVGTWSLVKE